MLCFLRGMAFLPFLLVTWLSAAFIISYMVALLSGHVNPFVPYISVTGTKSPEGVIFGIMITFSAFLAAATIYTRYKIVEKQNRTYYFSTPALNLVSFFLGLLGCIGMVVFPCFEDYEYHVVSAICEWTVAFGFIFYFLTFIQDFQSFTVKDPIACIDDI
uniref:DNA damage-regulated autophagy modulator protein 1-like n=1 Tax=Callithrix jacchus TaxID=9483 RepID=UPI00159F6105|nr:DNA damage-regulated autophagy modulator protein 1-like [Callithrix jacchus]